jgi:Holliday junction DNA helicase RuvA
MLGCVSHAVRGSSPASVTYEQVFGQRPEGVDDMRVLGIDPGLTRCGMGVVEGDVGRPLRLVDVNVLRTSSDEHVSMRLVHLERGIEAWLDEHRPEAVAIERVFARSDSSTIMGTAQASGIAMVAAARRGLPIALHTPSEVKAAVTGSGRADKAQVGAMVSAGRGGQEAVVIAFVRGEVADVTLTSAVLEVGGVGLELMCTPNTLATLRTGQVATLPTSMVVREDSLTLFGFADDDEKQVFELVQTASGVGPKLAQAMLAVLSPDAVRRAVAGDDVRTLTAVPGIGQKGAQRIILELKDRIGAPVAGSASVRATASEPWRDQVREGLVGLGWAVKDADRAIDTVADQAGDQAGDQTGDQTGDHPDVAGLLRAALRTLSRA